MADRLRRRLAAAPVALAVTSVLVFALPLLTGDEARRVHQARVAEGAPDPEVAARLAAELGTDRPLPVRYGQFLAGAARGDLGVSHVSRRPVAPAVGHALGTSLRLLAVAMTGALALAVPLGLILASRAGGRVDRLASTLCQVAVSTPEYVLGPALVLLLAVRAGVLPATGGPTARHLVLPALTLGLYPAGLITQLVRAEALDALDEPSVRTLRAAGVAPARVLVRHVGRLSVVSTVAVASSFTAGLLGGAVMVEVVFGIPGLGRLLHDAVRATDLPLVQGALLTIVGTAVLVGIGADGLHRLVDPRTRTS